MLVMPPKCQGCLAHSIVVEKPEIGKLFSPAPAVRERGGRRAKKGDKCHYHPLRFPRNRGAVGP